MMYERFAPSSKEAWLNLRTEDITSTEISVLFGLSPYMTVFELHHIKKDKMLVNVDENEYMRWGKLLEMQIAKGAKEDLKLTLEDDNNYYRIPEIRMGTSIDYKIKKIKNTPIDALLEIKNVSINSFSKWGKKGGKIISAPLHIELQLQHQLEVCNLDYGFIYALVGGNKGIFLRRKRDKIIANAIKNKIIDFWKSIYNNNTPSPDFSRDEKLIDYVNNNIILSHSLDDEIVLDATENTNEMVNNYVRLKKEIEEKEDELKTIRAYLKHTMGIASTLECEEGILKKINVSSVPGNKITKEMIGETFGGRKEFSYLKFFGNKD